LSGLLLQLQVDLKHIIQDEVGVGDLDPLEVGIDLRDFYPSVEWDLLGVPAKKNEKYYTCCSEPYPDITFNITIRRKTLFHTVNLIIPCIAITFLTVLVFYLPSDSGQPTLLDFLLLRVISIHLRASVDETLIVKVQRPARDTVMVISEVKTA